MIEFRCWYCNRKHQFPPEQIGEKFRCNCDYRLRVPRKSGGKCRVRSLLDVFMERFVYALGGGFIGLAVGFLGVGPRLWPIYLTFAAVGFLLGAIGGEAGVNLLQKMMRSGEDS